MKKGGKYINKNGKNIKKSFKSKYPDSLIILFVILIVGALVYSIFFSGPNVEPPPPKSTEKFSLQILSPSGGEEITGNFPIRWSATGDVRISIYYTSDPPPTCATCPPQKWHTVIENLPNSGIYNWNTELCSGKTENYIKIVATDGKESAQVMSGRFVCK